MRKPSRATAGRDIDAKVRFVEASAPVATSDSRTFSFVFSDESVDRYGDVIHARGWDLKNFNANPIALFGHDASTVENVVGRARNVRVSGSQLVGDIEFMGADVNPAAEVVYQMVKGGFLKTVSVGFAPIEWEPTKDKSRPGGIDFKRQELLEISVVPIPANPNALHQAKAAGIEVERLALLARSGETWTCGAARDLPLADATTWDGPGAEKRIFDAYGFDGDKPDVAKAARAFLFHDAAHPTLKGSYKEPFADLVAGELKAFPEGIRAASSRLAATHVPDDVKAKGEAVIKAYEDRMNTEKHAPNYRALALGFMQRNLDQCADFCDLLRMADSVCSRVEAEGMNEEDGSPIPGRMRAWVNDGNHLLADMTNEETSENIAGTQGSPYSNDWGYYNLQTLVTKGVGAALAKLGIGKAGKAISAANEKHLRAAHEHIMAVLEPEDDLDAETGSGEEDPSDDNDTDEEKAVRARKAAAAKRRAALVD